MDKQLNDEQILAVFSEIRINESGWSDTKEQRAVVLKFGRTLLAQTVATVAGGAVASLPTGEAQWQSMSHYGQVKVGDFISFFIGDKHFDERVKEVLNPGFDCEELIYNKKKNYYVISKNVLRGFGNVRKFRFFAAAPQVGTPCATVVEQISGEAIAWYSKQYGIVWMSKQLRDMRVGTKFYVRGRETPVAEVTSSACMIWNVSAVDIPHGTVFYDAPFASHPSNAVQVAQPSAVTDEHEAFEEIVTTMIAKQYMRRDPDNPECYAFGDIEAAYQKFRNLLSVQRDTASIGKDADCGCRKCSSPERLMTTFIVCHECGNKRCPKADNHDFACTNSNERGQIGAAISGKGGEA